MANASVLSGLLIGCLLLSASIGRLSAGESPGSFHVLAFYSTNVEPDHVRFAIAAVPFFGALAAREHFIFEATTDLRELTEAELAKWQVIVWLNTFPTSAEQRKAFERYMRAGGGWLGFHVAAYNDSTTHWPWFVDFLGNGVFEANNWPPLPAKLVVDDPLHPVTKGLPASFVSPTNEWYLWKPSPRENKDIQVLLTLSPANYPLGKKDILTQGDLPVVWTNVRYRMLYLNMGHGAEVMTDKTQNELFANALLWLGRTAASKKESK